MSEYISRENYDALLDAVESICDYVFEQHDNGDYFHRGNDYLQEEARKLNRFFRTSPPSEPVVPRTELDEALLSIKALARMLANRADDDRENWHDYLDESTQALLAKHKEVQP